MKTNLLHFYLEKLCENNVHVRRYECIRNSPLRYNPGYGSAREWKNDAVESTAYIIQYRDLNINVDTDDIRLLLAE